MFVQPWRPGDPEQPEAVTVTSALLGQSSGQLNGEISVAQKIELPSSKDMRNKRLQSE